MMESSRHELDDAIDSVAAKMVQVPADDQLLTRTISQLPMRSATPWLLTLPAQMTAAAALLLLAFVYGSSPREPALREPPLLTTLILPVEAAPPLEALARPPAGLIPDARSLIPDPRSPIPDPRSPIPDRPDHEFSLPPVDALRTLELSSISAPGLEPAAMQALVPLVLTDLPLASDSSSPHQR